MILPNPYLNHIFHSKSYVRQSSLLVMEYTYAKKKFAISKMTNQTLKIL